MKYWCAYQDSWSPGQEWGGAYTTVLAVFPRVRAYTSHRDSPCFLGICPRHLAAYNHWVCSDVWALCAGVPQVVGRDRPNTDWPDEIGGAFRTCHTVNIINHKPSETARAAHACTRFRTGSRQNKHVTPYTPHSASLLRNEEKHSESCDGVSCGVVHQSNADPGRPIQGVLRRRCYLWLTCGVLYLPPSPSRHGVARPSASRLSSRL